MASAHAQRVAAVMANDELATAKAQNQDTLNQGYGDAKTDLTANSNAALDSLSAWFGNARDTYAAAKGYYQPYAEAGTKALGAWQDASGLNGADGNTAARAAFEASPGYTWNQEQSADQTARKAASLGIGASGNTLTAIQNNASHLADQEWNGYLGNLQGLTNLGYNAAGQEANLTKGIGDLSAAEGTNKAGVYTTLGSGLAGLDTGLATNIANQNLTVASQMGQNGIGAGQATDAAHNANENLLLGVAGLGVNLLTGGLGGGLTGAAKTGTTSSNTGLMPYIFGSTSQQQGLVPTAVNAFKNWVS